MKFLKTDDNTYLNIDKIVLIEIFRHTNGEATIIHFDNSNSTKYSSIVINDKIDNIILRISNLTNQ